MRRPSPLPAPAPSPGRGDDAEPLEVAEVGPPRPAAARPSVADPAPDAGDGEGAVTDAGGPRRPQRLPSGLSADGLAPVVPLAAPGERAAPAEAAEPVTAAGVWKAARARRRALRAEMRRFTVRRRRRRIAWIAGLASVLGLVLATLGVAYSPLFAVERIQVVGTQALDPAAVAQALDAQRGRPLPLVDSSEVKAALVAFPLIETYALEARPPHDLVVRVVERTPVGQLSSPAGYTLVDAAGVVLSTTPEPAPGFPLIDIEGGTGSRVFDAVATVYRALPDDIAAQVTSMTATTPNDVALSLGDGGPVVVWGNADRSPEKAVVLAAAMVASPPAATTAYDVSSPSAVVVR